MHLKYGPAVIEGVTKDSALIVRVKKMLITEATKYQEVQIVETYDFGRALVLDGYIQSTEDDEFMYHETLVHPAMVAHPNPRKVLIVGGGEGATLREVLKHRTVEKAVMVDIDGELIELAKKHLDFMHQGAFSDPRARVVIGDGYEFVMNSEPGQFDVVILDLTDPYGPEISKKLYSKEFYAGVKKLLREGGIMVTQAGNSYFYPNTYDYVLQNIQANFSVVREYWYWIPSFSYACNFITGSDSVDPASLSEGEVDRIINERGLKNKLYSGAHHVSLFKSKVLRSRFASA
ncbi:MAG: polyamine aminopropyltransferase [Desulfurococcales archaeon]|nr:polyamine aminopropyltransferase [Desulfurococcales archaeon]